MNETLKLLVDSKDKTIDLNCPNFCLAGKCHDWRNHVPSIIKDIWDELSKDAKAVAFLMASRLADREEWE